MNKIYDPINWENDPSVNTPINETNLNKMDSAINELDDRVVLLDNIKLNATVGNSLVQNVDIDTSTGLCTVTKLDGTQVTTDLKTLLANFGLISSDTIEFEITDYDIYYLDYPYEDEHYQNLTVYTPDFTIEENSTNGYYFGHNYMNDNDVAININGYYKALKDKNGNYVKDRDLNPSLIYIIKYDAAFGNFNIIGTKEPGSPDATTAKIRESSIEEKHLSQELLDLIKKNGSVMTGIADYSVIYDNNAVKIGVSGIVTEYGQFDIQPII